MIEMAIVIVVIGLILGAVLISGGSVFGRAGVASLLSNIKDLATASRDFKTRYSYFPGDLPNAGTYITAGGAISAGCTYPVAGNVGNGIVDTQTESDCALEHLVKAGMLSKVDYDPITLKYFITSSVGAGVRLSLWYDPDTKNNVVRISNLPCDVALEIDRKLDSATANTPFNQGSVLAATDQSGTTLIQTCVSGSTNDPVPALLVKY